MFTAAAFIIAKTQKQPKCASTDEWIKKMLYLLLPYSRRQIQRLLLWFMSKSILLMFSSRSFIVSVFTSIYLSINIYLHLYIYIYVYICIYTHIYNGIVLSHKK